MENGIPEINESELSRMRERFYKKVMYIYNKNNPKCYEWRHREWIQNVIKAIEDYQNYHGTDPLILENAQEINSETQSEQNSVQVPETRNEDGKNPNTSQLPFLPLYFNKTYMIDTKNNEKILRLLKNVNGTSLMQLIPIEQYFDVIHDSHIKTAHGKKKKMAEYIRGLKIYMPLRALACYNLRLCKVCETKRRRPIQRSKPTIDNRICQKGFVEIISMTEKPDGEYNYILHYRDKDTDCTFLRPLQTTNPAEITEELLKLFLLIGCPGILNSNLDKSLIASVIEKLNLAWPQCILLKGKNTGSKYYQIKAGIKRWMSKGHENWSLGMYFVTNQMNRGGQKMRYDTEMTPFEKLLGTNPGKGLDMCYMPSHLRNIKHEEDLMNAHKMHTDDTFASSSRKRRIKKQVENLPGSSNVEKDSTEFLEVRKIPVKTYTKRPKIKSENQNSIGGTDKNENVKEFDKINVSSHNVVKPLETAESVKSLNSDSKKGLCVDESLKETSSCFENKMSVHKKKNHQNWNTTRFDLPQITHSNQICLKEIIDKNFDFGAITELDTDVIGTGNILDSKLAKNTVDKK